MVYITFITLHSFYDSMLRRKYLHVQNFSLFDYTSAIITNKKKKKRKNLILILYFQLLTTINTTLSLLFNLIKK